ncbi:hypothetical protein PI126_g6315 [Phytophthora idaei]|nr:hypothetical protein PI126_g6315 [Phytophthora idaei]
MDKTFEVHRAINAGPAGYLIHESDRLQLNTYQAFVRSAARPSSDVSSLLLMHMTGAGDGHGVRVAVQAAGRDLLRVVRDCAGYTKNIFKKELLRHSDFIFDTREEAKALREMEHHSGRSRVVNDRLELLRKRYQRRIANRKHVGIYQFYGYRQFANLVFNSEGLAALMKEQQKSSMEDVDSAQLHAWVREGRVRLNMSFVGGLRRSLFICYEVHNLYRNGSLNTLLLSATSLTTSALEIVPIAQLLTGEKLNSSEMFTPVLGVEQGEEIPGIRYARFVRCAPKGHQLSCLEHWADRGGGGANEEFGNNMAKDIAFPGVPELPEPLTVRVDPAHGLYESQVLVLPALQQYSWKYAKLVELCMTLEGKIFVYHPQVQGSGVNLLTSVLLANGLVLNGDRPGRKSKCERCLAAKETHDTPVAGHEFAPIQLTFITGSLLSLSLRIMASEKKNIGFCRWHFPVSPMRRKRKYEDDQEVEIDLVSDALAQLPSPSQKTTTAPSTYRLKETTKDINSSVICKRTCVCRLPWLVEEIKKEGDDEVPELTQMFFYRCCADTRGNIEKRDRPKDQTRYKSFHETCQNYWENRELETAYTSESMLNAGDLINETAKLMEINALNMIALHFHRWLHQYIRFRYTRNYKETKKLVDSCYRVRSEPELDSDGNPTGKTTKVCVR